MAKTALEMLNDLDNIEQLSDFQRQQMIHIINVAFCEGCINEIKKQNHE
jgi:hypothetical protein